MFSLWSNIDYSDIFFSGGDKSMKKLGILGGMGPLATCDLFRKVVENTRAGCDNEHIHIIIDNNSAIPDRTAAILKDGKDPLPEMKASLRRLTEAGADVVIMGCNTAHYFYDALAENCQVERLNMLYETMAFLKSQGIKKSGLLASSGTVESGIYARAAEVYGVELIVPQGDEQEAVMGVIYDGVKAGVRDYDASKFKAVVKSLMDKGAETMILGCTELPLAIDMYKLDFPAADPTLILAKAAIKACGYETKD